MAFYPTGNIQFLNYDCETPDPSLLLDANLEIRLRPSSTIETTVAVTNVGPNEVTIPTTGLLNLCTNIPGIVSISYTGGGAIPAGETGNFITLAVTIETNDQFSTGDTSSISIEDLPE